MLRGSFDQALWPPAFVVGAFKPAVCLHSHLLLGGVQACRLPAFKPLKCFAADSTKHSGHRHLVVRAFKPAVCLHSHLLLGRSSLPFASLQTPKILHGSFDSGHRHLVVRAFKPAVCLHSHLLLGRSSLPQASYPCGNFSDTSSWIFLRPKGSMPCFHTLYSYSRSKSTIKYDLPSYCPTPTGMRVGGTRALAHSILYTVYV